MVTAYDVETNKLITKVAEKLKSQNIGKPAFIGIVKTGAQATRPPEQEDFWYLKCASILWQAYKQSNIGTGKLRKHYGGRKKMGTRPERHVLAGGSTIRKAMQEMEKAGLLAKGKTGRVLTAKARKILDNSAKEVSG